MENIKDMDIDKVYKIIEKEPGFRKKQIDKLLFQDLISSWSEATTLPLSLREELNKNASIDITSENNVSKDGKTVKALITLEDGLKIETVLMKYKERNTVCVSSQVGCPLGCLFCATGKMGFKRNLNTSEIVEQVLYFGRMLKKKILDAVDSGDLARMTEKSRFWTSPSASSGRCQNDNIEKGNDGGKKITNIVFMGMGEPFLNYENVLRAIRVINDKEKFGLGARHISISTSGVIPGIIKFSQENLEVNLAISLHAPNNLLRSKLMPVNIQYSLEKLLEAVNEYVNKTRRKVMFEYILINEVNDTEKEAEELSRLMKHPLYMVNLIRYNQTGEFKSSSLERVNRFKRILNKNGISFTERLSLGEEIKGACGQLIATS